MQPRREPEARPSARPRAEGENLARWRRLNAAQKAGLHEGAWWSFPMLPPLCLLLPMHPCCCSASAAQLELELELVDASTHPLSSHREPPHTLFLSRGDEIIRKWFTLCFNTRLNLKRVERIANALSLLRSCLSANRCPAKCRGKVV
jgi:hypothetical protein